MDNVENVDGPKCAPVGSCIPTATVALASPW